MVPSRITWLDVWHFCPDWSQVHFVTWGLVWGKARVFPMVVHPLLRPPLCEELFLSGLKSVCLAGPSPVLAGVSSPAPGGQCCCLLVSPVLAAPLSLVPTGSWG